MKSVLSLVLPIVLAVGLVGCSSDKDLSKKRAELEEAWGENEQVLTGLKPSEEAKTTTPPMTREQFSKLQTAKNPLEAALPYFFATSAGQSALDSERFLIADNLAPELIAALTETVSTATGDERRFELSQVYLQLAPGGAYRLVLYGPTRKIDYDLVAGKRVEISNQVISEEKDFMSTYKVVPSPEASALLPPGDLADKREPLITQAPTQIEFVHAVDSSLKLQRGNIVWNAPLSEPTLLVKALIKSPRAKAIAAATEKLAATPGANPLVFAHGVEEDEIEVLLEFSLYRATLASE